VVGGYLKEAIAINQPEREGASEDGEESAEGEAGADEGDAASVATNSGIVVSYGIDHVVKAIDAWRAASPD
jgi:hypothetical protein